MIALHRLPGSLSRRAQRLAGIAAVSMAALGGLGASAAHAGHSGVVGAVGAFATVAKPGCMLDPAVIGWDDSCSTGAVSGA